VGCSKLNRDGVAGLAAVGRFGCKHVTNATRCDI
jgi:hypothetical protein